jgi:CSLREA domain-containing protein
MFTPRFRHTLTLALGLSLAGTWLAAPPPARAETATATFVVNTVTDFPDPVPGNGVCEVSGSPGSCTLRGAIQEANAWPGNDTITFSPGIPTPATFTLTRVGTDDTALYGDLDITGANGTLTINGLGAANTIIDGNRAVTNDRVFHVLSGTATLSGLTIRNGGGTDGAGIYNSGTTTLINSSVSENHAAGAGGGISNSETLTLINSTVSLNTAVYGGGGIRNSYVGNAGAMTIANSTIIANHANFGGGIASGWPMTLTNSTVSGNSADEQGGGVYNSGDWFARNSTLSGNTAGTNGGGAYNDGTAYLYSVTLAQNLADADQDGDGVGGGVYIYADGSVNVINTLIATNALPLNFAGIDCYGALTSSGGLRLGETAGCSIIGAYGSVSESSIGPLANNGGPTLTHALLPGSEAIDAGEYPSGCVDWDWNQLPGDQRGGTRYAGAWCDAGAFEYGALLPRVFVPLIVR